MKPALLARRKVLVKIFKTELKLLELWFSRLLLLYGGVYSFIYKEIIVPKSAPINISLNLSLQKSGTSDDRGAKFKKPIDAILLKIGAKNPSSRSVCLLPSYFIAYGYKMSDNHLSDERFVKGACDNPIVYKEGVFLTKHLTVAKTSVVALGNLIED